MRNRKMITALILAVLMLIGLIGCGAPDDPVPGTSEPSAPTTGNEPAGGNDPTEKEPAGGDSSAENEAPLADENLTYHENTFFTVSYNEEDGWTLAEDDIYLSEYGGCVYLRILDADGYTDVLIEISAYEEDAAYFREALYVNGIDLKEYVDGACAFEEIGGVMMAAADLGDGDWCFLGRNEAAGVSYTVYVMAWDDSLVAPVIENINFTASGTGNVDPPLPWDGEPFYVGTISQMVGTYTLTAQFLPMGEPLVTYETFDHDIAVIGDKVYVLSDYALFKYAYDGEALNMIEEIPLSGEYSVLEKGAEGSIILSAFMEPIIGHDGKTVQFSYDGPEYFAVAPGATWGISWFFNGNDCQLYSFHDGTLTGSPFPFPEVDSISQINIDLQYILVSGSSVEDGEQYVFVYDYAGELLMQLGGQPNSWGLGSITYATSTPNGFLALDANMREVVLWTTDGRWIGAVTDEELFGTGYPWIAAADMADDGSILIVMSDTRADESADEVLVYKLSGF